MVILNLFSSLLLSLFSLRKEKNIFNPALATGASWIVIMFIYILNDSDIYYINNFTFLVLLYGIISIQTSSILALYLTKTKSKSNIYIKEKNIKKFIILSIVFISLYILEINILTKSIGVGNNLIAKYKIYKFHVRMGSLNDPTFHKVLRYIAFFIRQFSLFLLIIDLKKEKIYIQTILMNIISITIIFLTGSRIAVFSYIFTIFFLFTIIRRVNILKSLKKIVLALIIFFPFFAWFGKILGKGKNGSDFQIYLGYLFGPLLAFNEFINSQFDFLYGQRNFRLIHIILYKLKIIDQQPLELVQNFSDTTLSVNVYTIFKSYIEDFGVILGIIFLSVLFYLFGVIYKKAINREELYLHLYSLILPGIFLQFFDDSYFKNFSMWIQIIIYLIIFYKTNIFLKKRR